MSKDKHELIEKKQPTVETSFTRQKNTINTSAKKLRVIITNKKNSSWVDDLHHHDKLNSYNRAYH